MPKGGIFSEFGLGVLVTPFAREVLILLLQFFFSGSFERLCCMMMLVWLHVGRRLIDAQKSRVLREGFELSLRSELVKC